MIEWISIRNLALIEKADIDFGSGFNVITGETGTGKSVIMSAISLLLGERAGKNIIRTGAAKCEISTGINLKGEVKKHIASILQENGLANTEDEQLLLKRIITATGSRNFINDSSVTLQTLKKIGDFLIDVHGPHEHQSLLKTSIQLDILDNFGNLQALRGKTAQCWQKLQNAKQKLDDLEKNLPSAIEAEHLKTILQAIETADIKENEDEITTEQHKLAANSRNILETSQTALQQLNESEDSIADRLGDVRRLLSNLENLELKEVTEFIKRCDELIEAARELSFDIEHFSGKIDLDEERFAELEERLAVIQNLKRKYGPTLDEVLKTAEDARKKLDEVENFEDIRNSLTAQVEKENSELQKAAAELSSKRKQIAAKFAKQVETSLQTLGFIKAGFMVEFAKKDPDAKGMDIIEFMFSANPGEGRNPLRKVASSGEISRVMLALKTVLADADDVPILVFDEIDVNIGGKTAVIVGQELKKLSNTHQLFCISHLPQVAAAADQHYKVDKSVKSGRTMTMIKSLDNTQRQEEITRMLGGGKAADKHAAELISASTED